MWHGARADRVIVTVGKLEIERRNWQGRVACSSGPAMVQIGPATGELQPFGGSPTFKSRARLGLRTSLFPAGIGARLCLVLILGSFLAHSIYGLYLDYQLNRFRLTERPRWRDRWNPEVYSSEGRGWLERSQRHARWSWAVWIGTIVGINLLCYLMLGR